MAQSKKNGKHSCSATKNTVALKDATQMCANWRRHYEKHIRSSHNEWLIEDMAAEVDLLNQVLYRQWKAGIICREAYQDCMAIAWEQWSGLVLDVREFEEQQDYLDRLCGCKDAETKTTDS